MPIHVDFTDTPSLEAVPAGVYAVQVTACDERVGKDSGNPYIYFELTIEGSESEGRKLFFNATLIEKSRPYLMRTLMALGWTDEELRSPDGLDLDPADFFGVRCRAVVRADVYEGEPRAKVTRLLPIDASIAQVEASVEQVSAQAAVQAETQDPTKALVAKVAGADIEDVF